MYVDLKVSQGYHVHDILAIPSSPHHRASRVTRRQISIIALILKKITFF